MYTKRKIIFAVCLVLIILGLGWVFFNKNRCQVIIKEEVVRGSSLSGLIENGETIKALFGYYQCHTIKRGDVVLYQYSGGSQNLIKIVKGIPGDDFHLAETEAGWHILINRKILKNYQNQPYLVGEAGYQMLSLYEKDYKGRIPENAYLLLGNLTAGSIDSTHFGLIGKSDILAKVKY